jgi:hypothetical protein
MIKEAVTQIQVAKIDKYRNGRVFFSLHRVCTIASRKKIGPLSINVVFY